MMEGYPKVTYLGHSGWLCKHKNPEYSPMVLFPKGTGFGWWLDPHTIKDWGLPPELEGAKMEAWTVSPDGPELIIEFSIKEIY